MNIERTAYFSTVVYFTTEFLQTAMVDLETYCSRMIEDQAVTQGGIPIPNLPLILRALRCPGVLPGFEVVRKFGLRDGVYIGASPLWPSWGGARKG